MYEGHATPMRWAGWTTDWDPDDRDDLLEHHRGLYRDLKGQHGGHRTPPDEIPGLLDGVEGLLEYGYSLTDIGVMIGVTRERVRQWVDEYDLNRPYDNGAQYRVWSDAEDRFVPVDHNAMKEQAVMAYRAHRKRAWTHQLALRWNRAVTVARSIAEELGRAPTICEVGHRVLDRELKPTAYMACLSGWLEPSINRDDSRTPSDVMALLYELAGLPAPQSGGAGHKDKRPDHD